MESFDGCGGLIHSRWLFVVFEIRFVHTVCFRKLEYVGIACSQQTFKSIWRLQQIDVEWV